MSPSLPSAAELRRTQVRAFVELVRAHPDVSLAEVVEGAKAAAVPFEAVCIGDLVGLPPKGRTGSSP